MPLLALIALLLVAPSALSSQGIWPERAENLQVLPADFPPDRLRAVMQGFTQALGVRCSYCHVGQEGQPLSTFDFVSDANPNKDRARLMYEMLGDVNRRLADLEPSGETRVNMWCHTCHAGKPRPATLAETLQETAATAGTDAVVARFLELREAFYGGNQYDFRAPNVDGVGAGLMQQGDTAAALRLFELNAENHPEFAPAHVRLGDMALLRGDRLAAIRHYELALTLAEGNAALLRRIEASLEQARGGG
ncbi:MAG TPA: c-type cytochrome [Longimicrobiales bacterium]|nr:c-type cytochrome [Longimicrobiales bacterium]